MTAKNCDRTLYEGVAKDIAAGTPDVWERTLQLLDDATGNNKDVSAPLNEHGLPNKRGRQWGRDSALLARDEARKAKCARKNSKPVEAA